MRDLERIRERRTYRVEGGHVRMIGLVALLLLVGTFYVGMKFGTPENGDPAENAAASDGESHLLLMNEPKTPFSAPALQYESVLGESADGAITLAMPSQPSPVQPTRAQRAPMHKKPSMPATATAAPLPQLKATETAKSKPAEIAKPSMPAMPSASTSTANAPGATQTGYTLQVKAFRTEEAAKRFNQELRQNGYDAFVVRSEIPEKGTWYRVRVGQYASLMKATEYQYHFESKEGLSTFVSPL